MDMQGMMEKAMQGMEGIPKCDECGGHLAGGAMTFNDAEGWPKTWCMKCVLKAIAVYQRVKKDRMNVK